MKLFVLESLYYKGIAMLCFILDACVKQLVWYYQLLYIKNENNQNYPKEW